MRAVFQQVGVAAEIEDRFGRRELSANAGHLAWTNSDATDRKAILAYSLAFLNHYVKGAPADPALTHPLSGVAQLRYASELGNSDQPPAARENAAAGGSR